MINFIAFFYNFLGTYKGIKIKPKSPTAFSKSSSKNSLSNSSGWELEIIPPQ